VRKVLSGTGRVIVQRDAERAVKVLVYVPLDVARDSRFPFQDSAAVRVSLDGHNNLIVQQKKP
jgi:hypothetical protein